MLVRILLDRGSRRRQRAQPRIEELYVSGEVSPPCGLDRAHTWVFTVEHQPADKHRARRLDVQLHLTVGQTGLMRETAGLRRYPPGAAQMIDHVFQGMAGMGASA